MFIYEHSDVIVLIALAIAAVIYLAAWFLDLVEKRKKGKK